MTKRISQLAISRLPSSGLPCSIPASDRTSLDSLDSLDYLTGRASKMEK